MYDVGIQDFESLQLFKDFCKDSLSFNLGSVFSGDHKWFQISVCIISKFSSEVKQYICTCVSIRHT